MATNEQILLNEILKQEAEEFAEALSDSEFFEFYSSIQILKEFELGYDEVRASMAGASHDGGADSLYLLVNGDLIKAAKLTCLRDTRDALIIEFKGWRIILCSWIGIRSGYFAQWKTSFEAVLALSIRLHRQCLPVSDRGDPAHRDCSALLTQR